MPTLRSGSKIAQGCAPRVAVLSMAGARNGLLDHAPPLGRPALGFPGRAVSHEARGIATPTPATRGAAFRRKAGGHALKPGQTAPAGLRQPLGGLASKPQLAIPESAQSATVQLGATDSAGDQRPTLRKQYQPAHPVPRHLHVSVSWVSQPKHAISPGHPQLTARDSAAGARTRLPRAFRRCRIAGADCPYCQPDAFQVIHAERWP